MALTKTFWGYRQNMDFPRTPRSENEEYRKMLARLLGVPVPASFESALLLVNDQELKSKLRLQEMIARSGELRERLQTKAGADSMLKPVVQEEIRAQLIKYAEDTDKRVEDIRLHREEDLSKTKKDLKNEKERNKREETHLNEQLQSLQKRYDARAAEIKALQAQVDELKQQLPGQEKPPCEPEPAKDEGKKDAKPDEPKT